MRSVGIYQNDNMTDVCIYSMNIEGKCTVEIASVGLTQAHPNYTVHYHNMSATRVQNNEIQRSEEMYHNTWDFFFQLANASVQNEHVQADLGNSFYGTFKYTATTLVHTLFKCSKNTARGNVLQYHTLPFMKYTATTLVHTLLKFQEYS